MSDSRYNKNRPFRQDDPRWKNNVMWDRDAVIAVHRYFNRKPHKDADGLLFKNKNGVTMIGNEGCLLTCLAMVLSYLLDDKSITPKWSNNKAHELGYYTPSGLSNAPLYTDLISEIYDGQVQLLFKREIHECGKGLATPATLVT